ncbi:MAG: 2-epi-5-epi-valiolone synthase [Gallionellales bacterium RBG_16_56_9]|nr:MAG: 2-epi-5-epi-valiolone synthase [Gallionellales bacterium RBG_16_56_9]
MSDGITRWRVSYQRPIEYDLVSVPNLFHPQNEALLSVGKVENGRRFVVVDGNVGKYYADQIRGYFAHHRIDARIITFPGGEENKTVDAYFGILRELEDFPIHRRDEPVIAIGGGVLTDVVGFIASSYRRSVPHIKVPTTLMGYVDASVGIKTGINFNGHKNRLGSFEPPLRVFLDRAFLQTLPRRHILNGVCEIIKLAIIKDTKLFQQLEQHGAESVAAHFQNDLGGEILDRAISGMLEELQPNLFEENLSRKVDFGHTFSYGLETRHEAHLLHGEAVLLDIVVSTLIARKRNLLSEPETARIFRLIDRLGIVLNTGLLDTEIMWQSLLERIEHRNGFQRVPMPDALGNCIFLNDITRQEIDTSIRSLNDWISVKNEPILER